MTDLSQEQRKLLLDDPTLMDRFWPKVNKEAPNGCWVWTGSKDQKGYGMVRLNGRVVRSHRVSYEMAQGPIPSRFMLDHVCHQPCCVNPDHLRIVSSSENSMNRNLCPINKCGLKGVSKFKNKWKAKISAEGISYHLGYFKTPELAHLAYCEAAVRIHGKFANFGENAR